MGDIEKAKREIRYAKSAADDKRWDLLETRIRGIEAALDGVSDAEQAPVLAELAPLREQMAKALREEQANRIEREIKRNLSNAEEGSEAQLEKAINRLAATDAQECLTAEAIQRLQAEIGAIQTKLGIAVSPAPASVAPTAPPAALPPASPPTAKPAAATPAAPLSDEGRAIENDVARNLMFAAEDVERDPERAESRIERAITRLDSAEAKQHLPAERMAQLRAQIAEMQAKAEAARQAEKIARIEDQIVRFMRSSATDFERGGPEAESMLRRAVERIESEEAKRHLPAPTIERLRGEIDRLHARITAARRERALERAQTILKELEQRAAGSFFDDHQPAYRVLGDLDYEKARVRGAIERLPSDDADVKAIEERLALVDERIADACAALDAEQARARVKEAWRLEQDAVAGWEEEQHAGGARTVEMPKSALALRRLSHFVADNELAKIRAAHGGDTEVQSPFKEAERIRDAAAAKLNAVYEATARSARKP